QGYESNNQTVEVRPSETASVSLDLKQISEESDQEQSSSDTEQAEQTSSANETNTSETNTSSNSSEDADSNRSAQADSEMMDQNNNVALKLVQDELQVAPAGAALLKVIHVSSNSPDINVVIARTQNEPSQTPQSNDEEQTEGSSQTAETEMNQEDQATSETSTDSAETSTETNQNDANQNSTTSETEQANQQGSLSITISPSQAQNAAITVTGPDDFTRELTGEGMLEGLKPGTYHVDATQTSYQPAAAEVEVTANSTAHASITLERLPEAGPVPIEGQNLFNQLAFESSSDYQVIPSGTFSLQLQQVDQDIQIAEVQDFSIEPGGTYSLIIYDQADQNNVALAIAVDVFAPQSEQNDQSTPSQDDSSESDDTPETESEAN
ncbi:MAG: hypothetical protein KC422_23695, partial [Trueperaceae bacterium]|nr:hypothetical protein [Trueperaceae bacterium]